MVEHLYSLFYVAAMAFALLDGGFRRRILYLLCLACTGAGFLIHSSAFAKAWISTGIIPSVNVPELLDLTVLFMVLTYFVSRIFVDHRELLFFLMPIIVSFHLVSRIIPARVPEVKPYFTTMWFPVHIFLLVSGMSLILFSFIYSAIFIMQDYSLRKKKTPNAMPLPSISASEKWGKIYLKLGFLFFTLGFFSSALYGIMHASKDSTYRPGLLEAATLLSWALLGAAAFGWIRSGIQPRKRAFLVIVGSSLFLFIFMGMLWH